MIPHLECALSVTKVSAAPARELILSLCGAEGPRGGASERRQRDEFPWNMLNGDGFVWTINPSVYPSFNEKFTCAMRFIRDEKFDPTGAFDPIAFVEFCKQVDTKVCEHAAKGQTPCKELQASYYNAHSDESESTKPNFVDYLKDIKKHFFTIKEGE